MKFRPMPIIGAILGLAIGLLVAALLSVWGLVPLDRLPLMSLAALGLILGALVLTQRLSAARTRVATVGVLAVLLAGVAVTGIPEYVSHGSLTQGCTLQATSSLEPEPVTPEDTSATDPFDMSLTDTVEWVAATAVDADGGTPSLALMVAGVPVPVWNGVDVSTDGEQAWTGTDSVERWQSNIRESTGITLTGIYHFQGTLTYATGECVADAYLRISPPHPFAGPLLISLWAAIALSVAVLVALAIVVAKRARREEKEPITDTLTTTGGAVSGAADSAPDDSHTGTSHKADEPTEEQTADTDTTSATQGAEPEPERAPDEVVDDSESDGEAGLDDEPAPDHEAEPDTKSEDDAEPEARP